MTNRRALSSAVLLAAVLAAPAAARDAEEPIKLAYLEGDLGGFSNILDKDGKEIIGVVTYTQQRKGDTLEAKRVAWFKDGSSDEDTTVAKVGKTLRTLRGQSIIRDPSGETIVDMRVDVAQGRVWGFYGQGKDRTEFDDRGKIPIGTYFGALVNLVLKNFDANVEGGKARVPHHRADTESPADRHGSDARGVVEARPRRTCRPGRGLSHAGDGQSGAQSRGAHVRARDALFSDPRLTAVARALRGTKELRGPGNPHRVNEDGGPSLARPW